MDHFTPLASTVGGLLIGLSATMLLLFNGRIAGISGILAGAVAPSGDAGWRWAFLGGLVAGGLATFLVAPELFAVDYDRTLPMVIAAGVIVGVGTRIGSGCTSGHGVCGLSRLSARSMVATVTFMATGALTVLAVRLLMGGAS
ncbi:MAG: YeeE/YedE family protein [Sandaracinaceae bacterium]|nr:YeeE/YedE family protein [Sandaracinaceae bacterium]